MKVQCADRSFNIPANCAIAINKTTAHLKRIFKTAEEHFPNSLKMPVYLIPLLKLTVYTVYHKTIYMGEERALNCDGKTLKYLGGALQLPGESCLRHMLYPAITPSCSKLKYHTLTHTLIFYT